jgi:hypothetical protein
MILQLFNTLEQEQQVTVLQKRGSLLATKATNSLRIALYQIDGFYVEVYSKKKGDKVLCVNSFLDMDRLDPYLEEIDLSDIIDCWL